jgi:hypothetical protein
VGVMGKVASSTIIQFRGDRSVIIIISQTSIIRALLLLSFAGPVKRRVKERECKKGVNIRFSFLGVYINKFSII